MQSYELFLLVSSIFLLFTLYEYASVNVLGITINNFSASSPLCVDEEIAAVVCNEEDLPENG